MAEQEEGSTINNAGITTMVLVDQPVTQAGSASGTVSKEHLSKEPFNQQANVTKSLHMPHLKTLETIELADMGTGPAAPDMKHQCVETTSPPKIESTPIVAEAVKHFETKIVPKIESEPVVSRFVNFEGIESLKRAMPKVTLPLEKTTQPVGHEAISTMTSASLILKTSEPLPLDSKATMTKDSITVESTSQCILPAVKSIMKILPEKTIEEVSDADIVLKDAVLPITQETVVVQIAKPSAPVPVEMPATMTSMTKTVDEKSGEDSIVVDSLVLPAQSETRISDWPGTTEESQKKEVSWNDPEYLNAIQLPTLSEAKLVLQDAPSCSGVGFSNEKPCGIALSLIPQRSETYFNHTAKTGFHFMMSKGSLLGPRSIFTISQKEDAEIDDIPKNPNAKYTEEFSTPRCLGALREKIDVMYNKITQYFSK